MVKVEKSDLKLRNISLLIIIIAIILLTLWMVSYITSNKNEIPLLLAFGVALLIGGIFLLTRIQYIIWIKQRF
jgi:uncharacterized membrane protein YjjP (DUF1212 family)